METTFKNKTLSSVTQAGLVNKSQRWNDMGFTSNSFTINQS